MMKVCSSAAGGAPPHAACQSAESDQIISICVADHRQHTDTETDGEGQTNSICILSPL